MSTLPLADWTERITTDARSRNALLDRLRLLSSKQRAPAFDKRLQPFDHVGASADRYSSSIKFGQHVRIDRRRHPRHRAFHLAKRKRCERSNLIGKRGGSSVERVVCDDTR